jgi:acyl carrier protein
MNDPLLERVRGLVADTFNVPLASVTEHSRQGEVDAWDSLGHLNVVLGVEQEFGISVSPEDGEAMTSVAAIVRVLRRELA